MKKPSMVYKIALIAGLACTAFAYWQYSAGSDETSRVAERLIGQEQLTSSDFMRREFGIIKEKKRATKAEMFGQPDKFDAYYRDITQGGAGVQGKSYPAHHKQLALTDALQRKYAGKDRRVARLAMSQLDWVSRGPGNVGGRTRAIVVDLDADAAGNTWFAGSASGGIWKTVDAGQSWANLTPDLAFLSTQALVQSASNPDVLYAGTGEDWMPGFPNVNGNGIYKSIDRGASWTHLGSTDNQNAESQFRNVSRLIIHPSNPDIVVASTGTGIFKTADGGASWQEVYPSILAPVSQVIFDGSDFQVQYAAVTAFGVLKSTDGGENWDVVFQPEVGPAPSGRIELAIAPTKSSRLAATVETITGSKNDVYVSDDSGQTWIRSVETGGDFVWMAEQGWYNNAVAFHPFSADTLYYAGIEIHRASLDLTASTVADISSTTTNTESFLNFIDFGGDLLEGGGSSDAAPEFGAQSLVQPQDYTNVQVRFGPGRSQKAHRFFSITSGGGYQDYIDVPFEVWNTSNNRQLMISIYDFNRSGQFDLTDPDGDDSQFILISNLPYDPDAANVDIANAGPLYKLIYFLWPTTPEGVTWDPLSHPAATIDFQVGLEQEFSRTSMQISSFSFREPRPNNTHVDHHNLTLVPMDSVAGSFRLLDGNDGGVTYSDDGGLTFTATLNGYVTTQFYGADKRPGRNEYVGGMQDNGTWQSPVDAEAASPYIFQIGGDGFDAVWNGANPEEWIGGAQGNWFWLVTNAGAGPNATFTPIFDKVGNGPFISILANTKSNPELVLTVSEEGVYRSDDFGRTWSLAPIESESWQFNSLHTQIVQSIANPQIVWAGSRFNHVTFRDARLQLSRDGGLTFSPVDKQYTQVPNMFSISGLETHPLQDSTAYVLHSRPQSPKIIRTTDLGESWQDISGFGANENSDRGFPDVAVFSLLVLPHAPETIWAGTEIGTFESSDNGASWSFADNGLPAVAIYQMKAVDDQIVVATRGRGIWSVTISELPQPPIVTLPPRLRAISGGGGGRIEMTTEFRSSYDSSFVLVDEEPVLRFAGNTAALDTTFEFIAAVTEPRTVAVSLASYDDGVTYKTADRLIEIFPLSNARASYATDFEDASDDFRLEGLALTAPEDFSGNSLNSPHPYPASGSTEGDLVATLEFPVVVSSQNSTVMFDEIAIVEPGNPGSTFGDDDFWDYVIVEGSSDNGTTWEALSPGYDSREYQVWLDAYQGGEDGQPSLFRTRSVDLQNVFAPGDEVLLRFRLFYDALDSGWGWALDNLFIQTAPVSVADKEVVPSSFVLSQNYPNPFNPETTITYGIPALSEVTLDVFNIRGQRVRRLVERQMQTPGNYAVHWNGRDEVGGAVSSGLYFYRIQAGDFVRVLKMTLLQ